VAVSVNVSSTNLLDAGFTAMVQESLERHSLPSEALALEITETSIITEFDRAKLVVDDLSELGIVVSIDDFGTGFTSLAYLSGLSVGELKLDRTFITSLADAQNERDLQLVRSTIDLGHALDMRVVAEGIEDGGTLDLLRQLGCDIGQGFFIGMPAPADGLAPVVGTPEQTNAAVSAQAFSGDLVPHRDTIERRRLHRVTQRA
jgi:EAL domain-containing protein (putative c-di-GMP-specific phosphodiesterase class I)